MNTEYKATCPAGHPRYGHAAGCTDCDPPARPVLLETKEHGLAVAYEDTTSDEQRPGSSWPELRP